MICCDLPIAAPTLDGKPLWACIRLMPGLLRNRNINFGITSMALSKAEKQARYRERHLEKGTKERGHYFFDASTKAKLRRLSRHKDCTVTALIEELVASAERRATAKLSVRALKAYYDGE
jgi:hypothetical protein